MLMVKKPYPSHIFLHLIKCYNSLLTSTHYTYNQHHDLTSVGDLSYFRLMLIVDYWCFSELIKKIVMGLSRKAKMEDVLLDADPVSVAAKATKICLSLYSGKVTVCLPGGTCISASDAITGFMMLLKTHYVFHENYPKSVKCVYAVLEGLAGIPSSVNAGAKSIRTVREITD